MTEFVDLLRQMFILIAGLITGFSEPLGAVFAVIWSISMYFCVLMEHVLPVMLAIGSFNLGFFREEFLEKHPSIPSLPVIFRILFIFIFLPLIMFFVIGIACRMIYEPCNKPILSYFKKQ
jgi:hypothetical protein